MPDQTSPFDPVLHSAQLQMMAAQSFLDAKIKEFEGHVMTNDQSSIVACRAGCHKALDHFLEVKEQLFSYIAKSGLPKN